MTAHFLVKEYHGLVLAGACFPLSEPFGRAHRAITPVLISVGPMFFYKVFLGLPESTFVIGGGIF